MTDRKVGEIYTFILDTPRVKITFRNQISHFGSKSTYSGLLKHGYCNDIRKIFIWTKITKKQEILKKKEKIGKVASLNLNLPFRISLGLRNAGLAL